MTTGIKWMMRLMMAAAFTLPVFAEEDAEVKTPEQRRTEMQARRDDVRTKREAEMLKRFDADGDGVLNEEERTSARAARQAEAQKRREETRARRESAGVERPARPERPERPDRPDRPERPGLQERPERPARPDRPDRPIKP